MALQFADPLDGQLRVDVKDLRQLIAPTARDGPSKPSEHAIGKLVLAHTMRSRLLHANLSGQ